MDGWMNEYRVMVESWSTQRKTCSSATFSPQISHKLAWRAGLQCKKPVTKHLAVAWCGMASIFNNFWWLYEAKQTSVNKPTQGHEVCLLSAEVSYCRGTHSCNVAVWQFLRYCTPFFALSTLSYTSVRKILFIECCLSVIGMDQNVHIDKIFLCTT